MLALSGGTALASEHMNHSAPSDITAVISMLVLIFYVAVKSGNLLIPRVRKIMERNFLLIFIIVSVIAIRER